jgi:hypothetical protein
VRPEGVARRQLSILLLLTFSTVCCCCTHSSADLNDYVIRNHGLPHSGGPDRFIIQDPKAKAAALAAADAQAAIPNIQGRIEWKWDAVTMAGVACDMESVGFRALCDSIYEVSTEEIEAATSCACDCSHAYVLHVFSFR